MALLLFASAMPASAQVAEANEDLEAEVAANFKGLNYDVPALDAELQAKCDELMSMMLTDPSKANKEFMKIIRKNRTKKDLALIYSEKPASAAAVSSTRFTISKSAE